MEEDEITTRETQAREQPARAAESDDIHPLRSGSPWKDEVLFIMGPTGTGKSQLAIEVALRFGGEVINADAMQLYQGLDIATAKVTESEMKGIPHHLLSVLPPTATCTVRDFQQMALTAIQGIHGRGRLPIVVGGTVYYHQSLLWETSLLDTPNQPNPSDVQGIIDGALACGKSLHDQLKEVDPVMAALLHPNDRRKIRHSLEVYHRGGRPHSELLREQKDSMGYLERPRFTSRIIWLDCQDDLILRERLNRRVDKMVECGLVEEARQLWATLFPAAATGQEPSHCPPDIDDGNAEQPQVFESGVKQSIGFKELEPYLTKTMMGEGDEDEGLLVECVDRLKTRTWRYVKKQRQWLAHRLAKQTVVPVYSLDSTRVEDFMTTVVEVACKIAHGLRGGDDGGVLYPCNSSTSSTGSGGGGEGSSSTASHSYLSGEGSGKYESHYCEVCDITRRGQKDWEAHLVSKMHKKKKEASRKKEKRGGLPPIPITTADPPVLEGGSDSVGVDMLMEMTYDIA